jgi:hypothetical protein
MKSIICKLGDKIVYCKQTYLKNVKYNNQLISMKSIDSFSLSSKVKNYLHNNIRESVIGAIVNKKIPEEYYDNCDTWSNMRENINIYLTNLSHYKDSSTSSTIELVHKGGRKYNYDFETILSINNIVIYDKIEFKYNCDTMTKSPQIVSPMKMSKYLSQNFEEYYYDHYLIKLFDFVNLIPPCKKTYINQIHGTKPLCLQTLQELYYSGCSKSIHYNENNIQAIEFYNFSKKISKEAFKTFIQQTDLDISKLSKYLIKSQEKKNYMLYKNSKFFFETINQETFNIISYTKNENKSRYECLTESGLTLNVLLRWKNGNGITFPCFQISIK